MPQRSPPPQWLPGSLSFYLLHEAVTLRKSTALYRLSFVIAINVFGIASSAEMPLA
jgi:hypothetical protein